MTLISIARSVLFCIAASTVSGAAFADPHMPTGVANQDREWMKAELVNSDNSPFSFKKLEGKLVLVNFFFTSCTSICAPQTAALAQVWKSLTEDQRNKLNFVSVTVDPKTDTVAALEAYKKRYDVKGGNWAFVRGESKDLDQLTKHFATLAPGKDPLEHKARMYLLDAEGNLLLSYASAPVDVARLKEELPQAVRTFLN